MARTKGSSGGIKSRTVSGIKYYYCYVDGRQTNLGRDHKEAKRRYQEAMAKSGAEPVTVPPTLPTNGKRVSLLYLVTEFDQDNQARLKESTAHWYSYELKRFLDWLKAPEIAAEDLTPHHLTRFCNALKLTNGAGEKNIKLSIKRAYRWAAEQKIIRENPFQYLMVPQPGIDQTYYDENQMGWILAAADPCFRELLAFAISTGWRFDEIRRLEARHVNLEKCVAVFPIEEHKTGKKTKRDLVKFLPAEALEIVQRKIRSQGEGFVFRTENGVPFTADGEHQRFRTISKKLGMPVKGSAFRKSYCTAAILRGVDIESLKSLMGHSSLAMISRHYSKIAQVMPHMLEAAQRAAGPRLLPSRENDSSRA